MITRDLKFPKKSSWKMLMRSFKSLPILSIQILLSFLVSRGRGSSPKNILELPKRIFSFNPLSNTYLILELARQGEMFDFISCSDTEPFGEKVGRFYFQQLISALEHCHEKGIVHRDIKPENLLVDEHFNLKIADFGFSKVFDPQNRLLYTNLGTSAYKAPEIAENKPYDGTKSDIFSAGIMLFLFIFKHAPFMRAVKTDGYYRFFVLNKAEFFWKNELRNFYTPVSKEFTDLITKIFSYDPNLRPTIKQIKAHPWYDGEVPTKEELVKDFLERRYDMDKIKAMEKKLMKEEREKYKNTKPMAAFRSSAGENGSFECLIGKNYSALLENLDEIKDNEVIPSYYEDEFPQDYGARPEGRSFMNPVNLYQTVLCSCFTITKNIKANHSILRVLFSINFSSKSKFSPQNPRF